MSTTGATKLQVNIVIILFVSFFLSGCTGRQEPIPYCLSSGEWQNHVTVVNDPPEGASAHRETSPAPSVSQPPSLDEAILWVYDLLGNLVPKGSMAALAGTTEDSLPLPGGPIPDSGPWPFFWETNLFYSPLYGFVENEDGAGEATIQKGYSEDSPGEGLLDDLKLLSVSII